MEVILAEFVVKEGRLNDWIRLMNEHSERCRRLEPGCLEFRVTQDIDDPTKWLLYEVYRDGAAIDAHRVSPHFKIYSEAAGTMYAERKVRRLKQIHAR